MCVYDVCLNPVFRISWSQRSRCSLTRLVRRPPLGGSVNFPGRRCSPCQVCSFIFFWFYLIIFVSCYFICLWLFCFVFSQFAGCVCQWIGVWTTSLTGTSNFGWYWKMNQHKNNKHKICSYQTRIWSFEKSSNLLRKKKRGSMIGDKFSHLRTRKEKFWKK